MLDDAGIKWRIIVVSACYSGGFIERAEGRQHADHDRVGGRIARRSAAAPTATRRIFGEALFQHALRFEDSFVKAFEQARTSIAAREKKENVSPPSDPQISVGDAMAAKLPKLEASAARDGAPAATSDPIVDACHSATSTPRPLAGLKVLELGQLIAGPFAGKIFAEFGAEVIKIEPPDGGDPLRQWRLLHEGTSLWWYVQARNKKSVTVNLRIAEGQDIVRRLARDADIVIENFRPGTLEKWGLGYDALAADNPGLILLRLSGFGQTGPYRDQPGFGAVGESMGGMRHVTGFPDRPPVRLNISIGDALAALHGVIGALMALHHRESRGGKGQVVDVALYEAVFNMMESLVPDYDLFGEIRERIGTGLTNIVPSNTYATRDGKSVVIAGNGDSIYKRLMHAIGRDDLGQDPALATNTGRVKRTDEIDGAIGAWTRGA